MPDFTGRSAFVTELGGLLATAEGSVMAVSAVAGIGGVGKTTLAVHVAHQARPHFPDGQLYVDLQGAGARAAEPETVLGSFLRALGTADSAIPDTLDERAALYRSTLDGSRPGPPGQRARRRPDPPAAARYAGVRGAGDEPGADGGPGRGAPGGP